MNSASNTEMEYKAVEPRVIVSLTTYPARIDRVHISIESLLHQTRPADFIVLWLAESQFPQKEQQLPEKLLEQCGRGLRIEWCEDIRSYKKLIPALEKWQDDIIITADDDIIYRTDMIEKLMASYARHPDCVSGVRTHLMLFDDIGEPLPYDEWLPEYSGIINQPSMALFPTTGAGTLFPPHIMPAETFNREQFMTLCPNADDVWVKCMLTLAGVKVVLADVNTKLQCIEGTQAENLYSANRTANDDQLGAVLNAYNDVGGEEHPEDTLLIRMNDTGDYIPDQSLCQKYRKSKSYVNEKTGIRVSVIIVAENAENTIKRCVSSVIGQSISDIEILCVDNASLDDTADILRRFSEQDGRVRVITLERRISPTMARRQAVLECRGEYCIFPAQDSVLAPDACEQMYSRAEDGDTDILMLTGGVIHGRNCGPERVNSSYIGRLRNRHIVEKEFFSDEMPSECLGRGIFGGVLTRRAYYQAETDEQCGNLFDYYILCRNAEVYVGEQSQIYYAAPAAEQSAEEMCSSFAAMAEYDRIAGKSEETEEQRTKMRRRYVRSCVDRWIFLREDERGEYFSTLKSLFGTAEFSAALFEASRTEGDRVLRELLRAGVGCRPRSEISRVGVAVLDRNSAQSLFSMTELLDCVAANYSTFLVGAGKEMSSAVVVSSKTAYVGAELNEDDADCPYVFAERLGRVIFENEIDALILHADGERFVRAAIQAYLCGVTTVAVMTEPLYASMLDCTRSSAGISALRLASAVVTDSKNQQRLLQAMGLDAKHIPHPALRITGGRSVGRASANAIVWAGGEQEARWHMNDALEIFRRVKARAENVRMLMYVDGAVDLEELSGRVPDKVSVRRLRPDYGIFDDAAVHLMTAAAGTVPTALCVARALGVPTVMYELPGETEARAGAVTTAGRDIAAAADAIVKLLNDRAAREQLVSEGRAAAVSDSREVVAKMWHNVLSEAVRSDSSIVGLAADELCRAMNAGMQLCEDGAAANEARLEEYRLRCERYEQLLEEAEQRRIKETDELGAVIEKTKKQLSDKERERSRLSSELQEVRGSTIYRVGAALTCIPRKIKKILSGLRSGDGQ